MDRLAIALCVWFSLAVLPAFSAAIGVAKANGSFRVDSNPVVGNATLFEGNTLETSAASSELQLYSGIRMRLAPDSRGRVFGDRLVSGERFGGTAGRGRVSHRGPRAAHPRRLAWRGGPGGDQRSSQGPGCGAGRVVAGDHGRRHGRGAGEAGHGHGVRASGGDRGAGSFRDVRVSGAARWTIHPARPADRGRGRGAWQPTGKRSGKHDRGDSHRHPWRPADGGRHGGDPDHSTAADLERLRARLRLRPRRLPLPAFRNPACREPGKL